MCFLSCLIPKSFRDKFYENVPCWWIYWDLTGFLASFVAVYQIITSIIFMNWRLLYESSYPETAKIIFAIIFNFLAVMTIWCYCKTQFTEPGCACLPKLTEEEYQNAYEDGWHMCKRCRTIKPKRVHHCSICDCCIVKMDHHCPWTNNCVGLRNQKHFMLFIIYFTLGEGLTSLFVLLKMYDIYKHIVIYIQYILYLNLLNLVIDIAYVLNCILTLTFFVFGVVMFFSQLQSIRYDITYIESLREDRTHPVSFKDSVDELMGEKYSYRWFLPVDGRDHDIIIKKILGIKTD